MRGLSHGGRSRRRLRREVKWTVTAVIVVLAVEFIVLPRLGGFRQSLNRVSHINIAYVIAGLILEAAALGAYAQLTYTVLSPGAPKRWRLLRIDLSSLALSHVVPGGRHPGWDCRTDCYRNPGCGRLTPVSVWPCRGSDQPLC